MIAPPESGNIGSYSQEGIDELDSEGRIYSSTNWDAELKQYMDECPNGEAVQSCGHLYSS